MPETQWISLNTDIPKLSFNSPWTDSNILEKFGDPGFHDASFQKEWSNLGNNENIVPKPLNIGLGQKGLSREGLIGTKGLWPCIGLIIYDENGNQAWVAHITPDQEEIETFIWRMIRDMWGQPRMYEYILVASSLRSWELEEKIKMTIHHHTYDWKNGLHPIESFDLSSWKYGFYINPKTGRIWQE